MKIFPFLLPARSRPLAGKSCWAATVLLTIAAGCGEVVQENKDLQMDRRQVDTYADDPEAEPEDHTLLEVPEDQD